MLRAFGSAYCGCRHASISPSQSAYALDRLEAAQLVERRSLETDKRSHAIYLTAQGRDLAEQGIAVQRRFVLDTLGRMAPDDLAKFESLLVNVRDLVRETESKAD